MAIEPVVIGTIPQLERKIRILKNLIVADKNKKDVKSLANHKGALKAHQLRLQQLKEALA